jgi:Tfp pilus assembly protein PilF
MEAKKAIETALAIDPNHSFTYNIYADLFLELNQAEEAKKQALKALELEPELL